MSLNGLIKFVIDNVTGLVTHSQWMSTMQNHFRQNKELMFFVTRPERFDLTLIKRTLF